MRRASYRFGFRYLPRATSSQQRPSVAEIMAQVGPDTHIMICAGDALTQDLRLGLLAGGFPEDRLYIEAFSLALVAEDLGTTISLGNHSFRPGPIGSLLEALEQGKVAPDSQCRWRLYSVFSRNNRRSSARHSSRLTSNRSRACLFGYSSN